MKKCDTIIYSFGQFFFYGLWQEVVLGLQINNNNKFKDHKDNATLNK